MNKARKPRQANNTCVKDYLKDTQDLTKNKKAVIGAQDDHHLE